jgi:hypothetical protein
MHDLTFEEFEAASERGRIHALVRPTAKSARHDRDLQKCVIELRNGSTFIFDPRMLQGLEAASDDELANLDVGGGTGLHWEDLDADFLVEGLVNGRFGTRRFMHERCGWPMEIPNEL